MKNRPEMRQSPRLTRVQFHPGPIPEGNNTKMIEQQLAASLMGNLPGFILRKETKEDIGIEEHDKLVDFINNLLLKLGAEFKAGPTKTKVKTNGVGDLHTDGVEAREKVLNFNIHSTTRGEGGLLFGIPGHEAKKLIDDERRIKPGLGTLAVRSRWEKPLHNLALSGETFAELIDPDGIFVGRVSEGDSVVIALESERGPMFHRFDTDTEDREALITELNRPE